MKKRFLLTMLAIFMVMAIIPFAALTAQATTDEFDSVSANYADYICKKCGKPCDGWFTLSSSDGEDLHTPFCSVCYVMQGDGMALCTPAEGTATCISPVRCSVCGFTMTTKYSPDPNAHKWSEWEYWNSDQHYRSCQHHCGAVEFEDHVGGDGSCYPTCEVCKSSYNDPDGEHRSMSDWVASTATQHTRICLDCMGKEEHADHADENKDHRCDDCSEKLTACADGNNDHKCDICDKALTECADENKDHKCDSCGEELTKCADGNNDHKCDVCDKALTECTDADKNGKCDVCTTGMPTDPEVIDLGTDDPAGTTGVPGTIEVSGTDTSGINVTDTGNVVTTANDDESSDDDPTVIIIVVSAVGVVAIGGAVAFVIIRKKK